MPHGDKPAPDSLPIIHRRRQRPLPEQASDVAEKRFGGQQGRRKSRKRRVGGVRPLEQGGIVQTPGQPATPEREPRHPDADKSGYEAIKEVLED